MEEQTICKEIDYLREAVELLRIVSKNGKAAAWEKRLQGAVGKLTGRMEQILKLLKEIEEKAIEQFKDRKEEVDFYFREWDSVCKTAGDMVVLYEDYLFDAPCRDLEGLKRFWQDMDEKKYFETFGENLTGYDNGLNALEELRELTDPVEIMRTILKLNVPEEEKWKLHQIFLEPQKHRDRVLPLLEDAVALLHSFDGRISKVTESFYLYWSRTLTDKDIYDYLEENTGSALGRCQWGTIMMPQLLRPDSVGMQLETRKGKIMPVPACFWAGVLYGEDYSMKEAISGKGENRQEMILYALKLLSDKSKFEILSYIKNREAYGSELARQLNLTTATISHHMSALVSEGLVEVTREDNKVYYRGRTEAIRRILEYCMEVLT